MLGEGDLKMVSEKFLKFNVEENKYLIEGVNLEN